MPDNKLRTKKLSKSGWPLSNARISTIVAVIVEATEDEISMIRMQGASDEYNIE